MTEVFCRFEAIPADLRGQRILLLIEGEGIDRLRKMTKDHEQERYKLRLEYASKRSLSQSDRFHSMARALSVQSGYSLDEAKAILKHEGGVVIPFGPGFQPPTREGRFVELYGEIEFQVSTAEYTKKELSDLMERSEQYLALAGVTW